MPGFRSSAWDPILIVAQIVCFQCVFYLSSGLWIAALTLFCGLSPTLDQLFVHWLIRLRDTEGRLVFVGFLLNTLTCSVGLWRVVRRTKQCLDFVCTAHLFHVLACWLYTARLPNTLVWWMTNMVSIILSTVLGEFLCMRSELKAIPLVGGSSKADL